MAEEILFKIELDSTQAQKDIENTTKDIDALKLSTKELQKQQKELEKQGQANSEQYQQNSKQIYENQQAQKKLNETRRNAQKILDTNINSMDAEKIKLSQLVKERNATDKSTVEGAKKVEDLNKEILALTDSLKANEQAGGDFRRNVGNYASALDNFGQSVAEQEEKLKLLKKIQSEVVQDTEEGKKAYQDLGKQIDETTNNITELKGEGGFFNKLSDGAEKFGVSTGTLNTILAASPIFILVGIVMALFSAFSKTSEGAKTLRVAMAGLNALLDTVVGLVGQVGNYLVKAFEDPQKSLKELGNFLITNLVNRFKAVFDAIQIVGSAMSDLANGDFAKLKDRAGELSTAFIQLNTGLDAEQQKKFGKAVSDTSNKLQQQTKDAIALEQQLQKLAVLTRVLEVEIANYNAEAEIQAEIAGDTTKSFKAQDEALLKSLSAREKAGELQLRLAQENLKAINEEVRIQQVAGKYIPELLDKQKDAKIQLIESQKEYTLAVQQNTKERNQLEQDRIEKDLDIQIDGFDKTKTINEAKIADDRRTIEEREQILEETKKLNEVALDAQKKSIEKLAGEQIDLQNLVSENDAVKLAQKIRNLQLSEIGETRLFEVVKEQQQILYDLEVAGQDLAEARIKREQDRINAIMETQKTELSYQSSITKSREEAFEIERKQIELDRKIKLKAIEDSIKDNVLKEEAIKKVNKEFEISEQNLTNKIKAFEQEKRDAVIETKKLEIQLAESLATTEEEKFNQKIKLLDLETAQKQAKIEQEVNDETLKYEALKQLELEYQIAKKESQEEYDRQQKERTTKNNEDLRSSIEGAVAGAVELYSQYTNLLNGLDDNRIQRINKGYEEQYKTLNKQLKNGYLSQEEYDQKTQELKEKQDAEVAVIQKRQFERDKKLRIVQALIETYSAASAAYKSMIGIPVVGPVLAPIAAGVATVFGLGQVAMISQQQFAEGGLVNGPSHAQGGIPFTVQGQGGYEMEGGEFIVKKSSVNAETLPILHKINNSRGIIKDKEFAEGGIVSANSQRNSVQNIEQQNILLDSLSNATFVVGVEDILTQTSKVVNVRQQANL